MLHLHAEGLNVRFKSIPEYIKHIHILVFQYNNGSTGLIGLTKTMINVVMVFPDCYRAFKIIIDCNC